MGGGIEATEYLSGWDSLGVERGHLVGHGDVCLCVREHLGALGLARACDAHNEESMRGRDVFVVLDVLERLAGAYETTPSRALPGCAIRDRGKAPGGLGELEGDR